MKEESKFLSSKPLKNQAFKAPNATSSSALELENASGNQHETD